MSYPQPPLTVVGNPASSETAVGVDAQVGDPELAERFAAGDAAAIDEVIHRYAPRVTRLVQRILAWQDDVADVVQETFLAALSGRKKFRGESRLETWLVRIAINSCRAQNRKQWLKRKLLEKWSWREAAEKRSAGVSGPAGTMLRETAEQVRHAVASLPHRSREVVVLYYLEEMTAAEVASVLGLRQNTVEVRLTRARRLLADKLAPLEPGPAP